MNVTNMFLASLILLPGQLPPEISLQMDPSLRQVLALTLIGPDPVPVTKNDGNGLRVTWTSNNSRSRPVGIAVATPLQGDFIITAGYEIVGAEPPNKGYGAGVRLYLKLKNPSAEAASLGRVVLPKKKGEAYLAYHVKKGSKGKEQIKHRSIPAESKIGKLRLSRIGTYLTYFASDGVADDFREIYLAEVGSEPIDQFSITATTGGEACALDVRLTSLTYRGNRAPSKSQADPAANLSESHTAPAQTYFLLVAIVTPLILACVAVVGWIILKRKKPRSSTQRKALGPKPKTNDGQKNAG